MSIAKSTNPPRKQLKKVLTKVKLHQIGQITPFHRQEKDRRVQDIQWKLAISEGCDQCHT